MISMLRAGLLTLNVLFITIIPVLSQIPGQPQEPADTGRKAISLPDTAQIRYFGIQNPERIKVFSDTSLDNHFHQYTPVRKRDDEYATLGYIGSAARPIFRPVTRRIGFDLGFHQFDVYFFNPGDFRFFTGNRPFSQGKWTLRSMGNDSNLDFEFGGHFNKNIYFSLNWSRINSSSTGNYKLINQSALNSCWGAALTQLKNNYRWSLGFTSNGFQQNDNGGLLNDNALRVSDTLLVGGKQSIPARMSQPLALQYANRNIEWRFGRYLLRGATGSNKLQITHQANLIFDRYKSSAKFSNRTAAQQFNDSIFLGNLLSDSRGVRMFIRSQTLENRISLSGISHTENSKAGNRFETGLMHRYVYVFDDKQSDRIQNMFAFAEIGLAALKGFQVNTFFHLGLLPANAGEYKAEGNILVSIGPLGTLEGKLIQQRYQPTYIQQRLVSTQREVWRNDFRKTFETAVSATWTMQKIGFKAEAGYQLLNNYIYFNRNFSPEQVTTGIGVFQMVLSEKLKIKHFGSDHFLALQRSTDQRIRLPQLSGKHSVYVEGSLFRKKAMLARLGVEMRYSSSYLGDAYQPLIGQFYWQDSNTLPFFPSTDAFISAKIKSSRVFVKVENISRSWDKRKVFYQTPHYPLYDTYFRIGIQRIFTD